MKHLDYEIRPFLDEFRAGGVEVQQHHWTLEDRISGAYFAWKYDDNPFADRPLGTMALHRGMVVGFRGFLTTRWRIGSTGKTITFLGPGDTVVHPDHREKGLSVATAREAVNAIALHYPVFLNFSCPPNLLPVYRRLGFTSMCERKLLKTKGGLGQVRRELIPLAERARIGEVDRITVSPAALRTQEESPWSRMRSSSLFQGVPHMAPS